MTFKAERWEDDEYVITGPGGVIGRTLSEREARAVVDWLPSAIDKLRASEWQPIATAPKDGTPVMVRGPLIGEGHTRIYISESRWCPGSPGYVPEFQKGFWEFTVPGYHGGIAATHWLPLPNPPEVSE